MEQPLTMYTLHWLMNWNWPTPLIYPDKYGREGVMSQFCLFATKGTKVKAPCSQYTLSAAGPSLCIRASTR